MSFSKKDLPRLKKSFRLLLAYWQESMEDDASLARAGSDALNALGEIISSLERRY